MTLCKTSAKGEAPPPSSSASGDGRREDGRQPGQAQEAISCVNGWGDLPDHIIYLIGEPLSRRDFLSLISSTKTFRKVLSAQVKAIKAFPQRQALIEEGLLPKLFQDFAYSEEVISYLDASDNPDNLHPSTLTEILKEAAEHGPKVSKLTFLCKPWIIWIQENEPQFYNKYIDRWQRMAQKLLAGLTPVLPLLQSKLKALELQVPAACLGDLFSNYSNLSQLTQLSYRLPGQCSPPRLDLTVLPGLTNLVSLQLQLQMTTCCDQLHDSLLALSGITSLELNNSTQQVFTSPVPLIGHLTKLKYLSLKYLVLQDMAEIEGLGCLTSATLTVPQEMSQQHPLWRALSSRSSLEDLVLNAWDSDVVFSPEVYPLELAHCQAQWPSVAAQLLGTPWLASMAEAGGALPTCALPLNLPKLKGLEAKLMGPEDLDCLSLLTSLEQLHLSLCGYHFGSPPPMDQDLGGEEGQGAGPGVPHFHGPFQGFPIPASVVAALEQAAAAGAAGPGVGTAAAAAAVMAAAAAAAAAAVAASASGSAAGASAAMASAASTAGASGPPGPGSDAGSGSASGQASNVDNLRPCPSCGHLPPMAAVARLAPLKNVRHFSLSQSPGCNALVLDNPLFEMLAGWWPLLHCFRFVGPIVINSMPGIDLPQIQLLELINEDPGSTFSLQMAHLPRTLKCLTLRGGVVQYSAKDESMSLMQQLQELRLFGHIRLDVDGADCSSALCKALPLCTSLHTLRLCVTPSDLEGTPDPSAKPPPLHGLYSRPPPTPLAALTRLQHLSTLVLIMDKDDAADQGNAVAALERYQRFLRDISTLSQLRELKLHVEDDYGWPVGLSFAPLTRLRDLGFLEVDALTYRRAEELRSAFARAVPQCRLHLTADVLMPNWDD